MLVTLLGIFVLLQPTIKLFVCVSIIALHSPRESYNWFPDTTWIFSNSQAENTLSPMLVTLLPIMTLVKPLQQ